MVDLIWWQWLLIIVGAFVALPFAVSGMIAGLCLWLFVSLPLILLIDHCMPNRYALATSPLWITWPWHVRGQVVRLSRYDCLVIITSMIIVAMIAAWLLLLIF